jgi:hypothetical protein
LTGKAIERALQGDAAAIDELTDAPPTTLAGMRAAIEYLLEWDGGHH